MSDQSNKSADSHDSIVSLSMCVNCKHQNRERVNHDGKASVRCAKCGKVYSARTYEVRAKGGQRNRTTGIKNYRVRVKEPDRDETLLEFSSRQDIELRAGDWITGSFAEDGKLRYLVNHKIGRGWDVQAGMPAQTRLVFWVLGAILGVLWLLMTIDKFLSGARL